MTAIPAFLTSRSEGLFLKISAVGVASLAVFAGAAWWWPWRPGRIGGLSFGILAALLFVLSGMYPLRRWLRTRPFGTAHRWLQAHTFAGVLAMLFVLIHIGFHMPRGVMGWLLLVLSFWTTATGLIGMWLQWQVPQLLKHLSVEAIYERIPELIAGLGVEADALMAESSEVLSRAYASDVRPILAAPRSSVSWLIATNSFREDALKSLHGVRGFLSGADLEKVTDLEAILNDKIDLDAQLSLQGVLRTWLLAHIPPAMLLFGLMAIHIAAVIWL